MMKRVVLLCWIGAGLASGGIQETLPPLKDGIAPQTFEELWAEFDPRAEPLEVEILKEWEEDGVVLKVLRYRIGAFKGRKAMMAAVYGYPKGGKNLPGLVQIHGGGQYAHHNACLTNAKRGYATLSISWGGRIDAPDYRVSPNEVKLFWDNKTDDPGYRVITDWGALDAYHAPCRNEGNGTWGNLKPAAWTLDDVESPRNSAWFLCAIGARRALTFLEQQPEVDGDRLGVYGHSMGGKLTVLTAGSDARVRAAAPSCGGISDRKEDELERATIGDDVYLKRITCPTVFLSPANDFHGRINDLPASVDEIMTGEWRLTCAAHHNHQDTAEYEVATQLWMDEHLRGSFVWPETPDTKLTLKTDSGIPSFSVQPDASRPVLSVDIFYTQQGQIDGMKDDRENTVHRFWHYAGAGKQGGRWTAQLPLFSTNLPLWVYANVVYPLDKSVTGAGYYYRTYTTDRLNLSSLIEMAHPEQLQAAGVEATMEPTRLIERFEGDWRKEWFSYRPDEGWGIKTHKVYHPRWTAPEGAELALEVRTEEANRLVIGIDQYAAEIELAGGPGWQTVALSPADFTDAESKPLDGWAGIKELRLAAEETLRKKGTDAVRKAGSAWIGAPPQFRNLRWVAD
jgi:hypothetical protein